MTRYLKSDLIYYNYYWPIIPKDSPLISGSLDETPFNRSDGNEILYIIMYLMQEWGLSGKESGEKLERMIKIHMPFRIVTQVQVREWIFENWKMY